MWAEMDSMTGSAYLEMLHAFLLPHLSQQSARIFFQQNGGPPHSSREVKDFLNSHFSQRWIGRGGPIIWSPRLPDLKPLGFFFWGYIKDGVYTGVSISSLAELKARIVSVLFVT